MRIVIRPVADAKIPHHLAHVELVLEDLGLRIVGTAIWKRRDKKPGVAVTLPSKLLPRAKSAKPGAAPGATTADFYEFVRDATPGTEAVRALRSSIVAAFKQQCPALALQAGIDESADMEAASPAS
jgi:hypothetical protein